MPIALIPPLAALTAFGLFLLWGHLVDRKNRTRVRFITNLIIFLADQPHLELCLDEDDYRFGCIIHRCPKCQGAFTFSEPDDTSCPHCKSLTGLSPAEANYLSLAPHYFGD